MYADNWSIKAKNAGYRSRAIYKLEEILNGNLLEIINKLKIEDQKIQLSEDSE